MKVAIRNNQDKFKVTKELRDLVRLAVATSLDYMDFPKKSEISVMFVDNEEIHALNREYRERDKPTDVLSFPMWEPEDIEEGTYEDGHAVMLGDIILSVEKAHAQAEEYGHSIRRELAFLSVHSTLHLLGYDHEVSEEDEKYMNTKQEEILTRIGQPRK